MMETNNVKEKQQYKKIDWRQDGGYCMRHLAILSEYNLWITINRTLNYSTDKRKL